MLNPTVRPSIDGILLLRDIHDLAWATTAPVTLFGEQGIIPEEPTTAVLYGVRAIQPLAELAETDFVAVPVLPYAHETGNPRPQLRMGELHRSLPFLSLFAIKGQKGLVFYRVTEDIGSIIAEVHYKLENSPGLIATHRPQVHQRILQGQEELEQYYTHRT